MSAVFGDQELRVDGLAVTPGCPLEDFPDRASFLFRHMREGFAYCRMIIDDPSGLDYEYLAINEAFELQTGLKDVLGKRVTEVIPKTRQSDPELLEMYAEVARTRMSRKLEMYIHALDEWYDISAYSPKEGYFAVLFDVITERKRSEAALRKSEETHRSLFDEAPFPCHELDCNGIVTRVNRTECELLGLQPDEIIGQSILRFIAPDECDESRESITRILTTGKKEGPLERKFISAAGKELVFQIHALAIYDDAGCVAGLRAAMIDVTNASRLNERLDRQLHVVRALLEQSQDHIYFKDTEGRFTLVNDAQARCFGCRQASELIGKTDFDFFTPEHASPALADEQNLIQGRVEVVSKEEKETWPDGRITWVHTTKLPFRNPTGRIIGTFGISRDVTAQRQMQQKVRESNQRFKLAEEALGIGTWDLDLRSDEAQCSEGLLRLYGRSGARLNRKEWLSCLHPEDRQRILQRPITAPGEQVERQFRVVLPDSSVRWLHSKSRVIAGPDGRPSRVIGIDFDVTHQVKIEERLRMLSSAVEQSPVSVIITDLNGNIEYVNPKASQVTGYTLEELKGRNPRLLKSGETSPEDYRELWGRIRNGEWRGIFHNKKKSGELFWESAAIRPIRNEFGVPTHYLAVKEDVTEKRATETALRLSEERFRVAAANASDVIFEWDVEADRFAFFGQSLDRRYPQIRFPKSRDELLSMVHPDESGQMLADLVRHRMKCTPLEGEYRIVQNDGITMYVSVRATMIRDSESGKYKSIGVLSDITRRKLAERANAELAAIVESANAAIYSRDLAGVILTWNAGAEQMYGYKPEEVIGRKADAIFPPDWSSDNADIIDKLRLGVATNHLETVRITKSGEPIHILLTVSPIRDGAGIVVGGSHIAWDITPIKLLQQQVAQAQKLESIGQLAAGIAHEINTPIQYVGDNAQFLETAFQDLTRVIDSCSNVADSGEESVPIATLEELRRLMQETDVEYLRREIPNAISQMQEGITRVAQIVRAMKRFSHPGPAEKRRLDINEAIESTILVCRNEWKYVAELATDLDPSLPPVPCMAGEFNQVVLNLIVNAAHAIGDSAKDTGNKGTIRVSTRRVGAFAEIRVSDNGTGIPESIRSKVFDPFFTTKPVGKGTGQGLSIAHAVIVGKHGGRIHFETESGKGTSFVVELPLEVQSEQA